MTRAKMAVFPEPSPALGCNGEVCRAGSSAVPTLAALGGSAIQSGEAELFPAATAAPKPKPKPYVKEND